MITLWFNGCCFRFKTDPRDPRVNDLKKAEFVEMCRYADRVVFQTSDVARVVKCRWADVPTRKWTGEEWKVQPNDIRVTVDGNRVRAQPEPQTREDQLKVQKIQALMTKALDGRQPYGV